MKHTRLLLALMLLSIVPQTAFALDANHWYVGASADYVYNIIETNTGYRENTYYDNGHGFAISLPVAYQFTDWLGLESGLRYVQKNYTWRHSLYMQTAAAYTDIEQYQNHFIEIPMTVNFIFGNELVQSMFSVGGYVGLWGASRRNGRMRNGEILENGVTNPTFDAFDEMVQFNPTRDNRFEAGLLARTGLLFIIDPVVLYLRGSFSLGLTDLSNSYQKDQVSRYNNTLSVEAGILVKLGGGK